MDNYKLRFELTGHKEIIDAVQWSPDGRYLASSSENGDVIIWDMSNQKQLYLFNEGYESVYGLAWMGGNEEIAACTGDSKIFIYDIKSGKRANKIVTKDSGNPFGNELTSIVWDKLRHNILAVSYDEEIVFLNRDELKLNYVKTGHTNWVYCNSISHDNKYLATGSIDQTIKIFDLDTNEPIKSLKEHSDTVFSIAWSCDDTKLLSAGDHRVIIWDTTTWEVVETIENDASVNSITLSAGSHFLAVKKAGVCVDIWDINQKIKRASIEEKGPGYWCSKTTFHPKENILATLGNEAKNILIWGLTL